MYIMYIVTNRLGLQYFAPASGRNKNGENRCTFTEVIAKLKQGYHFFGPPVL